MTEEETEEVEPEEGSQPARRMVFVDLIVLMAAFAYNLFNAVVILCDDTLKVVAAHANHRRDVIENKKAVKEFRKQLSGIPETADL